MCGLDCVYTSNTPRMQAHKTLVFLYRLAVHVMRRRCSFTDGLHHLRLNLTRRVKLTHGKDGAPILRFIAKVLATGDAATNRHLWIFKKHQLTLLPDSVRFAIGSQPVKMNETSHAELSLCRPHLVFQGRFHQLYNGIWSDKIITLFRLFR